MYLWVTRAILLVVFGGFYFISPPCDAAPVTLNIYSNQPIETTFLVGLKEYLSDVTKGNINIESTEIDLVTLDCDTIRKNIRRKTKSGTINIYVTTDKICELSPGSIGYASLNVKKKNVYVSSIRQNLWAHEILHTYGFRHTYNDTSSIMFPLLYGGSKLPCPYLQHGWGSACDIGGYKSYVDSHNTIKVWL